MRLLILIAVLLFASAACAQFAIFQFSVPVSSPGALLLEDNASILLLENGVDHFCLESGC